MATYTGWAVFASWRWLGLWLVIWSDTSFQSPGKSSRGRQSMAVNPFFTQQFNPHNYMQVISRRKVYLIDWSHLWHCHYNNTVVFKLSHVTTMIVFVYINKYRVIISLLSNEFSLSGSQRRVSWQWRWSFLLRRTEWGTLQCWASLLQPSLAAAYSSSPAFPATHHTLLLTLGGHAQRGLRSCFAHFWDQRSTATTW